MKNINLSDYKERLLGFKSNQAYFNFLSEISKIDSISDYPMFCREIKNLKSYIEKKKYNCIFTGRAFGAEGALYGHRNAFFEYAGLQGKKQNYLLPYFEHGVNWQNQIFPAFNQQSNHSFVLQGGYKNELIHSVRKDALVYNIGPYVLYAKPYYTDERIQEIKKRYGRIMLVYPLHTYEGADAEFDRHVFVKTVMDRFKNEFDTIMISVYWNDVDDPMYKEFASEGALLVSAGYRGDLQFISRLRTIIEIADGTSGNHIGTHIGYCMALRKPHIIFDTGAKYNEPARIVNDEQKVFYRNVLDKFFYAFAHNEPTKEEKECQDSLFENFWGGKTKFKTIEEAKAIINVSELLFANSRGNSQKILDLANDVVYGHNKIGASTLQKSILCVALGENI